MIFLLLSLLLFITSFLELVFGFHDLYGIRLRVITIEESLMFCVAFMGAVRVVFLLVTITYLLVLCVSLFIYLPVV